MLEEAIRLGLSAHSSLDSRRMHDSVLAMPFLLRKMWRTSKPPELLLPGNGRETVPTQNHLTVCYGNSSADSMLTFIPAKPSKRHNPNQINHLPVSIGSSNTAPRIEYQTIATISSDTHCSHPEAAPASQAGDKQGNTLSQYSSTQIHPYWNQNGDQLQYTNEDNEVLEHTFRHISRGGIPEEEILESFSSLFGDEDVQGDIYGGTDGTSSPSAEVAAGQMVANLLTPD